MWVRNYLGSAKNLDHYWQCFPRDRISISFKDMGYTSEDIGGEENFSDLRIMISDDSSGYHEYSMRRVLPTSTYEHRFKSWLKLMKIMFVY